MISEEGVSYHRHIRTGKLEGLGCRDRLRENLMDDLATRLDTKKATSAL